MSLTTKIFQSRFHPTRLKSLAMWMNAITKRLLIVRGAFLQPERWRNIFIDKIKLKTGENWNFSEFKLRDISIMNESRDFRSCMRSIALASRVSSVLLIFFILSAIYWQAQLQIGFTMKSVSTQCRKLLPDNKRLCTFIVIYRRSLMHRETLRHVNLSQIITKLCVR